MSIHIAANAVLDAVRDIGMHCRKAFAGLASVVLPEPLRPALRPIDSGVHRRPAAHAPSGPWPGQQAAAAPTGAATCAPRGQRGEFDLENRIGIERT